MPRSVNAVASRKRRKKILDRTKGYWGSGKNVYTTAKNLYEKGLTYAYNDRRKKKGNFRSLWIARINAATREYDMSYSELIGKLKEKNIILNRKVLADLAVHHPKAFEAVINEVKS